MKKIAIIIIIIFFYFDTLCAEVYLNVDFHSHLKAGNLPSTYTRNDYTFIQLNRNKKQLRCMSNVELESSYFRINKVGRSIYTTKYFKINLLNQFLLLIFYDTDLKTNDTVKYQKISGNNNNINHIRDSIQSVSICHLNTIFLTNLDTGTFLKTIKFHKDGVIEIDRQKVGRYKIYTIVDCKKYYDILNIRIYKKEYEFIITKKSFDCFVLYIAPTIPNICKNVEIGYLAYRL